MIPDGVHERPRMSRLDPNGKYHFAFIRLLVPLRLERGSLESCGDFTLITVLMNEEIGVYE